MNSQCPVMIHTETRLMERLKAMISDRGYRPQMPNEILAERWALSNEAASDRRIVYFVLSQQGRRIIWQHGVRRKAKPMVDKTRRETRDVLRTSVRMRPTRRADNENCLQ